MVKISEGMIFLCLVVRRIVNVDSFENDAFMMPKVCRKISIEVEF